MENETLTGAAETENGLHGVGLVPQQWKQAHAPFPAAESHAPASTAQPGQTSREQERRPQPRDPGRKQQHRCLPHHSQVTVT